MCVEKELKGTVSVISIHRLFSEKKCKRKKHFGEKSQQFSKKNMSYNSNSCKSDIVIFPWIVT